MNIRKRILTQLFCSKIDCPRFSFTRTWRSAASSASRPSGTRKISGLTRPRIRWRNIFLNYLPHLFKQAIIGIFFPILPFQNTDVKFSIILKLSVYQNHFPRLIRLKLSPFRSNLNNICLPGHIGDSWGHHESHCEAFQRLVGIDVDRILKLARWMTTFVNQRWDRRDNCCHNLT